MTTHNTFRLKNSGDIREVRQDVIDRLGFSPTNVAPAGHDEIYEWCLEDGSVIREERDPDGFFYWTCTGKEPKFFSDLALKHKDAR